jgi:hypothetical protein
VNVLYERFSLPRKNHHVARFVSPSRYSFRYPSPQANNPHRTNSELEREKTMSTLWEADVAAVFSVPRGVLLLARAYDFCTAVVKMAGGFEN